ncbi:MAG: G5 domain-containing protein [Ruminococcus sp.]|nr:G5 domain-containing protein [Ruminococcus sp.]
MKKLLKNKKIKAVTSVTLSLILVFSCAVITADATKNVKLVDGEKELTIKTYESSTSKILSRAQVEIAPQDKIVRKENSNLIYIEVLRAFPVSISYHNMEYVEFMASGTVSDVLKKANIELTDDDVINVSADTPLKEDMKIVIDEVKYITDTDTKALSFKTQYKYSDEFDEGYTKTIQNGKLGVKEIATTYKYVNGKRSVKCSAFESIVKKPQNKVVLKGTKKENVSKRHEGAVPENEEVALVSKPITSTAGTIDGLSYSKVLKGSATAYTAESGAVTSTGVEAYVGGVAVNPDIIPYGSKLYIVADGYTYGYATAVDTGGALMSGTALVDLYMSSYDECINFGRRDVTVYILD